MRLRLAPRPFRRRVPLGAPARLRLRPTRRLVTVGNVLDDDADVGAQTGLVMKHELDPKAQAAIEKIGTAITRAQQRGPWLVAAAGALVGLGLAGTVWWFSQKKRRKARRSK